MGQSPNGSERTSCLATLAGADVERASETKGCFRFLGLCRFTRPPHQLLPHDVAIDDTCLRGFEAAVEVHGGLHIAMSEQAPDQFILTWPVFQNDRSSRVAELMRRDPKSNGPLDPFGDL